jgi:hypothetical protein
LQTRYDNFIIKKSRNTKEAAKLLEYITVVERGFQGTEIIQATKISDPILREKYLSFSGLKEIHRMTLSQNKYSCILSVLQPINIQSSVNIKKIHQIYDPQEIILCLVDNDSKGIFQTIGQLLRIVSTDTLQSYPVNDLHNLTVLSTFYQLSISALNELQSLPISLFHNNENNNNNNNNNNQSAIINESHNVVQNSSCNNINQSPFTKIRLIGHSGGAVVASYLSLFWEGMIAPDESLLTFPTNNMNHNNSHYSQITNQSMDSISSSSSPFPSLFLPSNYMHRVQCFTFGAIPCLSRSSSLIPSFIISMICGDDLLARAHREALEDMSLRIHQALLKGAGRRGIGYYLGASVLSQLSTTAGKVT